MSYKEDLRAPQISIVIVSWNVRDFLRKCLLSIFQNSNETPLEVLVTDNASSDGSAQMVAAEFPSVKLIANTENLGFAAAANQGIRGSCGKYVLLLNPDTEVICQAIQTMALFMDEHENVGVVGCKLVRPDGSLQRSRHGHLRLLRTFTWAAGLHDMIPRGRITMQIGRLLAKRFQSFVNMGDYNSVTYTAALNGSCLLLRRQAVEEIGLLDERYFMYGEEWDLCFMLGKNGWKIAYTPLAKVIHHGGQSSIQVYRRMRLEIFKSHILLYEKHHGRRLANLAKALIFLGALIRPFLCLPRLILHARSLKPMFSESIAIMKWAAASLVRLQ